MNSFATASTQAGFYRLLPSVDEVLHDPAIKALLRTESQQIVADCVREALSEIREQIVAGSLATAEAIMPTVERLPEEVSRRLRSETDFSLCPVINATGVILHTNLGRAPLAGAAIRNIGKVAKSYSNLEFNLVDGGRGERDVHLERLFSRLLNQGGITGVRTVVVNNCAAAVMLALNTLAEGCEVIVSRGELVEIGGSFRVPDIMRKSGAVLREVGTTNRTRIQDYEHAISEETGLLLRVHQSNFSILGFTEQPPLHELVTLGRKHQLPVMQDLGGGAVMPLHPFGINEATVHDSLRAGIDLVTYSGDKMLGGPQAGVLSGREDLIRRMRSNPLFRALRVDKLICAALEGTLLAYVRMDYGEIPFARMIQLSADQIRHRALDIQKQLKAVGLRTEIIAGESLVGGGSAPESVLPTFLLTIVPQSATATELARQLRTKNPPIISRVENDRVLLDLRTVSVDEQREIVEALSAFARKCSH